MEKIVYQHLPEEDVERSTWHLESEGDSFLGYFEQEESFYRAGILAEENTEHYDKDPRFFSGSILEVESGEPEEVFESLLEDTSHDSSGEPYSLRPETA